MSTEKKKIYCAGYTNPVGYIVSALCEDGEGLAQHCCSHEGWARHDIGISSKCKHELYDEHCGIGGWELEWVDDPENHSGWRAALILNRMLAARTKEAQQ